MWSNSSSNLKWINFEIARIKKKKIKRFYSRIFKNKDTNAILNCQEDNSFLNRPMNIGYFTFHPFFRYFSHLSRIFSLSPALVNFHSSPPHNLSCFCISHASPSLLISFFHIPLFSLSHPFIDISSLFPSDSFSLLYVFVGPRMPSQCAFLYLDYCCSTSVAPPPIFRYHFNPLQALQRTTMARRYRSTN